MAAPAPRLFTQLANDEMNRRLGQTGWNGQAPAAQIARRTQSNDLRP